MSVWCYWINLCCIHFALMDSSRSLMSRNSQQAIIEDMEHKWIGPITLCYMVLGPFLKFMFLVGFFLILVSSTWGRHPQNQKAGTFQVFKYHPAFILIPIVKWGDRKGVCLSWWAEEALPALSSSVALIVIHVTRETFLIQKTAWSWLVWLSLCVIPQSQRSPVRFPGRAHATWVVGSVPCLSRCEGWPIDVSLSHQCFAPSLLPPSLSKTK